MRLNFFIIFKIGHKTEVREKRYFPLGYPQNCFASKKSVMGKITLMVSKTLVNFCYE